MRPKPPVPRGRSGSRERRGTGRAGGGSAPRAGSATTDRPRRGPPLPPPFPQERSRRRRPPAGSGRVAGGRSAQGIGGTPGPRGPVQRWTRGAEATSPGPYNQKPRRFLAGVLIFKGFLPSGRTALSLDHLGDVCRLRSLGAFRDLELDALALLQRLEAFRLDGAEVDEYIRSAFLGDKAIPLRVVEPLHSTLSQLRLPPSLYACQT